jgi:pimeloyl-ACP methyl ester carboxylesterase
VLHRETDGFDELDALCARYQDQAWYADLRGNIFQAFKHLRGADRDVLLADVLTWRTPLDHDPREIIRAVDVPQLWALGADDLDAPAGETLRRLAALRADGRDITTVVFDGAQHGMTMFETDSGGRRIATSYPAGYFQMILDFAAGTFDSDGGLRQSHRVSGT